MLSAHLTVKVVREEKSPLILVIIQTSSFSYFVLSSSSTFIHLWLLIDPKRQCRSLWNRYQCRSTIIYQQKLYKYVSFPWRFKTFSVFKRLKILYGIGTEMSTEYFNHWIETIWRWYIRYNDAHNIQSKITVKILKDKLMV